MGSFTKRLVKRQRQEETPKVFLLVDGEKLVSFAEEDTEDHLLPVFSSSYEAVQFVTALGLDSDEGIELMGVEVGEFLDLLVDKTFPNRGISRLVCDREWPIPLVREAAEWADHEESPFSFLWKEVPDEAWTSMQVQVFRDWLERVSKGSYVPPRKQPRLASESKKVGGMGVTAVDREEVDTRLRTEGVADLSGGHDPWPPGSRIVVKVQRSQGEGDPLLVYDEDRRIHMFIDENRVPDVARCVMRGAKLYLWATVDDECGLRFHVDESCEEQPW